MASWRHWPLYAWRAARRPPAGAEAEWPWSRMEARAYLSGSAGAAKCGGGGRGGGGGGSRRRQVGGLRPLPQTPAAARAARRARAAACRAALRPRPRPVGAPPRARAPLLGAATRRGGRPVDAPQIEPLLLSTTAGDGSAALRQIRRGVRTVDLPPAPPAPPPSIAAQQPPPPLCEAQRVLARAAAHYPRGDELPTAEPAGTTRAEVRGGAGARVVAAQLPRLDGGELHPVRRRRPHRAPAVGGARLGRGAALDAARSPRQLGPSRRRCRRRRRRRGRLLLRRRTKVAARRLAAARGDASRVQPQSARQARPFLLDLWRGALLRAGGVPLWLATGAGTLADGTIAHAHRALRAEALARGVAPRRLLFAARAPTSGDHLRRLPACDVALDALRWGAHATALDALGASVGVLTARGGHVASRTATSLVDALGAPATATASLRAYADAFAAPAPRRRPADGRAEGRESRPARATAAGGDRGDALVFARMLRLRTVASE